MGSFSWIKADYNVYNQANIVYGDKIKILVPSELGGGFIEGVYGDYGLVTDNKGQKFDILELVAIWNSSDIQRVLRQLGHYDVEKKGISDVTKTVRKYGIAISCYDSDHARIKYPIKIVDVSFSGSYEDISTFSANDPVQGFHKWGFYDDPSLFDDPRYLDYKKYIEDLKDKPLVISDNEADVRLQKVLDIIGGLVYDN